MPGFAVDNYNGFVAPHATPADRVALPHREINRSFEQADLKARLGTLGIVPFPLPTPDAFGDYIRSASAKYAKLLRAAGIRAK